MRMILTAVIVLAAILAGNAAVAYWEVETELEKGIAVAAVMATLIAVLGVMWVGENPVGPNKRRQGPRRRFR